MKSSKKALKSRRKNRDPLVSDLSHLFNEGGWKQVKFELQPKNKLLTIRVSNDLLDAIKVAAAITGFE